MKILIDNGHGVETAGKCSPDKTFAEWIWTRDIAAMVVKTLVDLGYDAELLVPETRDVKLQDRVYRVNQQCYLHGSKNVVVVSIHVNAAGADGQWHTANGWSVFVSENKDGKVSKGSATLSKIFVEEACKSGRNIRRPRPDQSYWVKSLAITRDTLCPAVLTENFFMDNKNDVSYLLSHEGKRECVRIHVDAIRRYIEHIEGALT